MGIFLWHQWARYVAIFASVYCIWAGFWGILFRKFFWDFVNGTLQPGPNNVNGEKCADANPCGIVPARGDQIFIDIIVVMPVVQIATMLFGIAHLFLELLPQVRTMAIYRSYPLRIVTYTLQTFFACLFYQGTNGAIYSACAVIGYIVATARGEIMEEAKEQRGNGGGGSGSGKV